MTTAAWLLLSWVLTLAAWLFVHVLATYLVLRSPTIGIGAKRLALLPPCTPFVAWSGGLRAISVLWMALAVGYVLLRAFG